MPFPNRAYIFSPSVAFVPHPEHLNRWVRVHPCVLMCDCPDRVDRVDCGAKVHQLCRSREGTPVTYTHYHRRRALANTKIPYPAVVHLNKGWRK